MRKTLLGITAFAALAAVPASAMALPVSDPFVAPTPVAADRADLGRQHAAANKAEQAKTAGRIPTVVVITGVVAIAALIAVAST